MTLLQHEQTKLSGLFTVRRKPAVDDRGFFERIYCDSELQSILGERKIRQVNRSFNKKIGTLRGLHLQNAPHSETKIISCLRGEVFDVAVDLRPSSPTYLEWHAETLSESNCQSLVIPEGFAHGFQTLSAECELLYLHTAPFNSQAENGVNAMDPSIGIQWPRAITERSQRDANLPFVTANTSGVRS